MRLRGQYRVIVADPYGGTLQAARGRVTAEPVGDAGAADSLLVLWAGVAGKGLINGDVLHWAHEWAYEPLAVHTWERVGEHGYGLPELSGVGLATSELFVLCRRGNPDIRLFGMPPNINSVHVWRAPQNPLHKPAGFYAWLEAQTAGPYLAMWTNPLRGFWDVYGLNQVQEGSNDQ